ncbi:MFS transporter [Sinomonas sp. ASV322]|uniref:MFS transporter n=1 Tax=Sinomonas sp. ASV322 TaxID=3041920 RepID=UPI0027DE4A39|nr:MFS transporter [Sinomonas sp. ASV322]MDQ4504477.1 MFS transporter [Sinomonas sp. ASV322]
MSTEPSAAAPAVGQRTTAAPTGGLRLDFRAGRWIEHWNPEDTAQWEGEGRAIARRNLAWSIFAEFLGFVIWQLWSIVVVSLPAAGFKFDTSQTFWLISMPSLVGATLRIPYTFMVSRFGGRNWTIFSALLLLIPALGLAACVSNPSTPFWVMLLAAGLAGFGGGNFASSMANITFFYPAKEKGWALGLNAAGGNLGAAVSQLAVPIAVSLTAVVVTGVTGTKNGGATLAMAGLMWVPLILIAAFGAWRNMHNLSNAKGDVAGSLAALKEPHLWIVAFLYIGTFGSFIGFSGVFPKLIKDLFPTYSTFAVGAAALSLAFLGPLVGSLARPYGGKLADRFGGARITVGSFAVMAVVTLGLIATLPLKNFWLFLVLFLTLFAASGIGNGSTYRMIPVIFARASRAAKAGAAPSYTARLSSAALGLISAIGAYGGFAIPQLLGASSSATGSYVPAFFGFVGAYALMLVVSWACYLRRGSAVARTGA